MGVLIRYIILMWEDSTERRLRRDDIAPLMSHVPKWAHGVLLSSIIDHIKEDRRFVAWLMDVISIRYRSRLIRVVEKANDAAHAAWSLVTVPNLTESERSRLVRVIETANENLWTANAAHAAYVLSSVPELTEIDRARLIGVIGKTRDTGKYARFALEDTPDLTATERSRLEAMSGT